MSNTRDFLNQLPHATLKALTRKLNLDVGIKNYTKLSRDELINELEKRTNYTNGKLMVSIPITELELPAKKQRKPRAKKTTEQTPVETNESLTAQLASFINTLSAQTTNTENQKVDEKQDMIAEAIAQVETIEKDTTMTQEDKKDEILNILQELQEDKPEIDLSILSKDKKEVNENLDDGLKEFTKKLFQSFYEDELDELDALSFNFGNSDIEPLFYPTSPNEDIQQPKKIVTAEIDENTGMITVQEEEDIELMEATRNIERMRAQSENIMKPIQEEPKPMLKSYIDELNDELALLDEMSFNYGLLPFSPPSEVKREQKTELNIQKARQPGQGLMEQKAPLFYPASPAKENKSPDEDIQEARQPGQGLMEEKPKPKKQIFSAPSGEAIEDPGQWIKDNLTPTKRFKTPNEKHRWLYYPREEIDSISDMGVLDYLKDEVNTFRGLSKNHTDETLYYIKAAINSIQDRQDALYLNRGRGRPMKGKQASDKEEARQKRLTDTFDNLPEPDKTEFYNTIKKIDSDVNDYMRDYARYESYDDSYKPFSEDWKYEKIRNYKINGKDTEIGPYDIIDNMYSFNSDIEDILERNDIDRDTLASWIELHIERKNYLAEFNRLIAREEKIKKRDPKLIQKSATKIQAAARGFLERRKLEREGMEKSQTIKQKEQSAEDKYRDAVSKGALDKQILEAYLETPRANAKQIMKDVGKFITDMRFKPGTAKTANNRVIKLITQIRNEKAKELYDIEFNRKEFNTWKDLLLKQPYAPSGRDAKIYDLKKQYKKADETKQTQILEKFAEIYNQQKVERLLTNYNIESLL